MFPTSDHPNYGFYLTGLGATKDFSTLMTGAIPDLNFWGSEGGQFFSRFTYELVQDEGRYAQVVTERPRIALR